MFFDPLYLVFALPALILALVAQARVRAAVGRWSKVRTGRGMSGAHVARAMLDAAGLQDVAVEQTRGILSDHYDPRSRTLRLSPDVFGIPSVASVGIAAHEAGHALQHADRYWPLQARSAIVPAVQFGSWLGPIVFFLGLLLRFEGLAWVGVLMFAGVALFALVTLPVELDASRRAKLVLEQSGYATGPELQGVNQVLNAAALTYIAGLAQALSTLLYYVFLLTGFRRRD